jgi:hypothetical protein
MIEISPEPAFICLWHDGRYRWFCRRCDRLVDLEREAWLRDRAEEIERRSTAHIIIAVVLAALVGAISLALDGTQIDQHSTFGDVLIFTLRWLLGLVLCGIFAPIPFFFVNWLLDRCGFYRVRR